MYPWILRLHVVNLSISLKLIYRFYMIPIKFPAGIFVDNNKQILNLGVKPGNSNGQKSFEKEHQKTHAIWFQDLLQSCNNQESVIIGKDLWLQDMHIASNLHISLSQLHTETSRISDILYSKASLWQRLLLILKYLFFFFF